MRRQLVQLRTAGARDWGARPVAIIGGGPSLQGFDFNRLANRFTVLAVNASFFDVPFADAGFSIDRRGVRAWWPKLRADGRRFYLATPEPWLINFDGLPPPSMRFIRRLPGDTFSRTAWHIHSGGTSGFGALQLAFLKGARRIVLFGFDYGAPAGEAWHHNEKHYSFPHQQIPDKWSEWARNFNNAAPVLDAAGVEVINASPDSAISAFPRVSIEEALA